MRKQHAYVRSEEHTIIPPEMQQDQARKLIDLLQPSTTQSLVLQYSHLPASATDADRRPLPPNAGGARARCKAPVAEHKREGRPHLWPVRVFACMHVMDVRVWYISGYTYMVGPLRVPLPSCAVCHPATGSWMYTRSLTCRGRGHWSSAEAGGNKTHAAVSCCTRRLYVCMKKHVWIVINIGGCMRLRRSDGRTGDGYAFSSLLCGTPT